MMLTRESSVPEVDLRAVIDGAGAALVVPGVGTPLEARAAQRSGAQAIYVSGYATAAWRHGLPDIGIIALAEIAQSLRAIAAVVDVPLIVDADTGYGDVVNVANTVATLEAAGASAIQLEDQTWPKRCGHLSGKSVVPVDDMVRKVRAAVQARSRQSTLIIARTDARATHGVDEAIDRANRYVDAGADAIFVDAPESEAELEEIAASVPGILVANMSESGRTPMLSRARLTEMGYAVLLYPTSALRIASSAFLDFYGDLLAAGDSSGWLDRMSSLDSLNTLVGMDDAESLESAVLEEQTR